MIITEFEDYCSECSNLGPTVTRMYGDNQVIQQIISCTYSEHCRELAEYMKKKFSQTEENENA